MFIVLYLLLKKTKDEILKNEERGGRNYVWPEYNMKLGSNKLVIFIGNDMTKSQSFLVSNFDLDDSAIFCLEADFSD